MSQDGRSRWPVDNGNQYSSLKELFAVNEVHGGDQTDGGGVGGDVQIFESIHPAFGPGNMQRAFGGHVYAQAVVAATKTVKSGFAVHSITGHFLIIGNASKKFTYRVSVIRSGASYAQRRVDVVQNPKKDIVFTAVVSFKVAEESPVNCSRGQRLKEKYGVVIAGREPESWPEAPSVDSPFWWEVEKEHGPDPFPGLDVRKVDMNPYNLTQKSSLDRIQLQYYRAIGPVPSVTEDTALHAAGHLYASDRNGLFPIPNFLGEGDSYSAIASLNHTVIFHGEAADYNMLDAKGQPKWFCIEATIEHISNGRCMVTGKLWNLESGRPVATYMQDGLVRMKEGVVQSLDGHSIFLGPMKDDPEAEPTSKKLEKL